MRDIVEVAGSLGLAADQVLTFGPTMAKLRPALLPSLRGGRPRGKLVLVSAMTPTRAGEGKTTVSIGLAQGLSRLGRRAVLALREPSVGPVFGAKGGGTGGGRARLEPSARINLHFTGDLHAIAAANNLLAALVDDALYFGRKPRLDVRSVRWRRALDVNDRALRQVVVGLGGGSARETGFDITAASEVMAVLCLSTGYAELKERLGRMVVGADLEGAPVTAGQLQASGAMAALLYDALLPNLVQSGEGVPAFVHGGPFANIAHGCNSLLATQAALAFGEVAVTEAGFAFDLGGEKFLDLKCRTGGLWPDALVFVVTARALRLHGGEGGREAIAQGMRNVDRHVLAASRFGLRPVVAINVFREDDPADLQEIEALCRARGLRCARCTAFEEGGAGAVALAEEVWAAAQAGNEGPRWLYPLDASVPEKLDTLAKGVYGGAGARLTPEAQKQLEALEAQGFGRLPVCVAKTQMSLSDDPNRPGAPEGFTLTIRELRVRAGAGFVLALAGDILTMPGLPRRPAAYAIDVDANGEVSGVG